MVQRINGGEKTVSIAYRREICKACKDMRQEKKEGQEFYQKRSTKMHDRHKELMKMLVTRKCIKCNYH